MESSFSMNMKPSILIMLGCLIMAVLFSFLFRVVCTDAPAGIIMPLLIASAVFIMPLFMKKREAALPLLVSAAFLFSLGVIITMVSLQLAVFWWPACVIMILCIDIATAYIERQ